MASVARGISSPHTPRSVEQITKAAQDYDYDQQIPLRYWLRSAAALPQQADIYSREGDDDTTYLLLFRHAHLILAHLTTHPEGKSSTYKTQLAQVKSEVDQNLKRLDVLRPKINQRYEQYTRLLRDREAHRYSNAQHAQSPTPSGGPVPNNARDSNSHQQLDGQLHTDIAVELAQREFSRRADARSSHQISERNDKDDLSQRLQSVRSRIGQNDTNISPDARFLTPKADYHAEYDYPQIHPRERQSVTQTLPRRYDSSTSALSQRPIVPPKPSRANETFVPPRPEKVKESGTLSTAVVEPKYTFASTASLENGTPLRTMFLPPTLRTTFLRIAYQNTLANLETCAFLAGTLVSNALFVSKLVVPAQISTSDTCEMTNESQLFDYVDSQDDLMVLGWIHTHPTQTCFMSSRDLHTHAGYQMMLAESIAVVCAPSKGDSSHGGDWGAFRLTDPPGKVAILNCSKPGIFHPHEVENVYTDALRPGHVVEAKGLDFEVVDLR